MSSKITSLSVQVPYKSAGNTIIQKPVSFDIYREENNYKAIPCLSDDERRIANLPDELVFHIEKGRPISARGNKDGNFHVIKDLVKILQEEKRIPS